ncbi:hypothetical protein [Mastigocoleus testarum]|uniref:hypothetical protein n=1 Tax=Mastigocoleus testarum TaxID=996925 RepID=UPI000411A071|nr:hypothetical protein [Mastigocoleus testarum]
MRQPVGVENELLNLVAETLALYGFELFLLGLRLAQRSKAFICKGCSDFSGGRT